MVGFVAIISYYLITSSYRHEHIYEKIENHLLRSDELPSDLNAMERTINGSPVILCTLSMLSNPILKDRSLYKLVPVERLVVDEASQIDVGEFMVSASAHCHHVRLIISSFLSVSISFIYSRS